MWTKMGGKWDLFWAERSWVRTTYKAFVQWRSTAFCGNNYSLWHVLSVLQIWRPFFMDESHVSDLKKGETQRIHNVICSWSSDLVKRGGPPPCGSHPWGRESRWWRKSRRERWQERLSKWWSDRFVSHSWSRSAGSPLWSPSQTAVKRNHRDSPRQLCSINTSFIIKSGTVGRGFLTKKL